MFSVYAHLGGGGGSLPHLHPIILQLVRGPFSGATPVISPQPDQDGVPLNQGWDTPLWLGQDGVPPSPSQNLGTPFAGQVVLGQVTLRAVHLLRFPAGGVSLLKI